MKKATLNIIRFYQRVFSKGVCQLVFLPSDCCFQPSCSEYAYQAINKYGTIKGLFMGLWRVLRCQPYCSGGYDPVK